MNQKGELNGECARTACNGGPAIWLNSATERYYCTRCAREINAANGEICSLASPGIGTENKAPTYAGDWKHPNQVTQPLVDPATIIK